MKELLVAYLILVVFSYAYTAEDLIYCLKSTGCYESLYMLAVDAVAVVLGYVITVLALWFKKKKVDTWIKITVIVTMSFFVFLVIYGALVKVTTMT